MKLNNVEDIYGLSPIQEALLATELAAEAGSRWVELSCQLVGRLDVAAFKWAWQQVLNRHAILRTSFVWKRLDKPVQVVNRELAISLDTHDWRSLPADQQLEQLHQLRSDEPGRGVNPATPPLLRLALSQISDAAAYLICTYHPLILDERSLRLILQEVLACYESASNGRHPKLAPSDPFWSYVNWVKQQDLAEAESFWSKSLRDLTWQASLAETYPHGELANQAQGYDEEWLELPVEILTALRELAARCRIGFETLMQGAWILLLNRESGAEDIVYGLLKADRPADLGSNGTMLGPLSNTLPVRVQVPPGLQVISWLKSLQRQLTELRSYEFCNLDQIRLWAALPPQQPLFQCAVVQDEELIESNLAVPGSSLKIQSIESVGPAGIPLVVRLPQATVSRLRVRYDRQFFARETVQRMLAHFQALLEGVIENPGRQIFSLPIMSCAEAERVLIQWNQTTTAYPKDSCIHELFEQQARDRPEAIAAVYEDEQLTYAELNARANQLAHHLQQLGVQPETRIALCVERSLDMLVGILGILKAGGAYVPLDPAYPLERLSFMLEDLQAPVVLTDQRWLERLPAHWGQVICLDADWEVIALQSRTNPVSGASAENLAYVMYTSGSTGTPKGVSVSHRAVVRLVRETNYIDFSPEEVFLQFAPISFDASTLEIWGSLLNGGRLAVMPAVLPSLDSLGQALQKYGVTTLWLTAGLFHLIVDERLNDLHPVRQLLAGGDSLSVPHVLKAFQGLPACRLINGYGPTEGTTFTCCYPVTNAANLGNSVPIGKPISNTQVFILDRYLRALPVGMIGGLYIAGDGLARDYHNQPALTAERFVPNPYGDTPGARLYKTGDLVRYLSDGNIEFLGRLDSQVKVRGFRIELGEIEAALSLHPSLQEVVVVARADIAGEKQLVAYLVTSEQTSVSEIREFLGQRLPDHMIPSAFVTLEAMPLTPNGKVDRQALPAPDGNRSGLADGFVAPRTPTEELLAVIWSQALGVNQVGIDDNFFSLGGDSIRSVQVLARVQQRGLSLSLQDLFQYQTIRELARIATTASDDAQLPGSTQPFSLISEQDRQKLPDGVEDAYPLTMLQAGMVFHSELNPETAVFHDIFSHHLRAPYNPDALRKALEVLGRRHGALRTCFVLQGFSESLQLVLESVDIPLQVGDLRDLSPSEQDSFLRAQLETRKNQGFDWGHAPLINLALHRRGNDSFQFTLSFHHAILDGWSMVSMLVELFQLYTSFLNQGDAAAEEAPLVGAYSDYVAKELRALRSEACSQYWADKLSGSSSMSLPRRSAVGDRKDNDAQVHRVNVSISPELSAALKNVARSASVPVKSVLLAAHLKVMSLIAGEADITTGLVANGRPEEGDGERLLGLFLNTIPFRQRIDAGAWTDLIQQTFQNEWEALPFRRYPLAQMQREQSGRELFETAFNFTHFHVSEALQGRSDIELLDSISFERTNVPLIANFSLDLRASDIQLSLVTEASRFTNAQTQAIADYYHKALTLMAAEPEHNHQSTSLLSASELDQLLHDWNSTGSEYPSHCSLAELFEQQAARVPNRIAVEFEGEQLSYAQLNERANQLAHYLTGLGVGPEVLVGVCVERSMELLVGVLGVLKAGGAYVPLDPAYPAERLAFMLQDAGVSVLLLQQGLIERLPAHAAAVVLLDAEWERIARQSAENLGHRATADNLAYVIYTSGSTGRPKGVQTIHRAVINRLNWMWRTYPFEVDEVSCLKTRLSFVDSVWELFGAMLQGVRTVIIRDDVVQDPLQLINVLAATRVSRIVLVPSLLRVLLNNAEGLEERLGSVKYWVTSGEALAEDLCRQFQQRLPKSKLLNLYGSSEVSADVTWYETKTSEETGPVPIGVPISNTRVYILDQQEKPVPVGVAGDLYVGGVGLARGYWRQAGLTAERFVPDSLSGADGERLFATGDRARYREGGDIEFLGRLDHQVKVRGFRIELGEVEAQLAGHEELSEAVVVGRQEGADDLRLIAYVVAASTPGPGPESLRGYLQERLPEYMVPSAYVVLEEMPLTPSGKVDRLALPAPGGEALAVSRGVGSAPRNEIEQLVHSIWAGVLKLESFGIHDNFFALGGHSLLATQVVTRLRESLQMAVPLRQLFTHPTVAQLGRWVETAMRDENCGAPPLQPAERTRPLPLSFAQQRLWFIEQLAPGTGLYNMPLALRLRGALRVEVLERALSEIVRRHEVLRTSFAMEGEEPVQVIAAAEPMQLEVADLRGMELGEREEAVEQLVKGAAQEPFDLSRGPLLRGLLVRLEEAEHIALLTMHHISSDGWSVGVLLREVAVLYGAYARGEASPLAELEIQYGDYAVWQREWLQGEELERQLGYWRKQLRGAPAVLELPQDHGRPAVQTHQGATQPFVLEAEVSEQVRQLSRAAGMTTFMVLLAAWQVLLKGLSGTPDISVGTAVAGRTDGLVEPLIGFFVNTLVLRTDLSGDPTFAELLERVREVCVGAYGHQEVPFEKLVEELAPERSLAHTPLFQVMLVMQQQQQQGVMEQIEGLAVSGVGREGVSAKYDLTLHVREASGALSGELEYNTDIFEEERARRMVKQWERVLAAAVAQPQRRISELPLLSEGELQQLLVEWNETAAEYPSEMTLPQLFEAQVERTPEAVALISGNERITYHELNRRANQLAHHLMKLGVGPEVLVGISVERSVEMVVGLLGILKAGGAYLPLDPAYPRERLGFMVEDAGLRVILAQEKLLEGLPDYGAKVVCLDADWDRISLEAADNPENKTTAANSAYVIYTSGSTGKPKGVTITHQNVLRLFQSTEAYFNFGAQDVWTLFHSYAFDFSVWELWGGLLYGGKVIVVPYWLSRSPEAFYQLLVEERVTILNQTPSAFRQLIEVDGGEAEMSLRLVIFGGEALDFSSLKPWYERRGDERPQLVNMYGITETTVHVTYRPLRMSDPGGHSVIGRALPDLKVCVLDKHLRLVPAGVTGEMYVGGAGLGRGYLDRPHLTAERFIPDPFSSREGARLYRTGDVARFLSDGDLEYLGRSDDQVKIRGFRIELGEIEARLLEHPELGEAVVVARQQEDNDLRIVAYLVAIGESEPRPESLRAYLRETLPDYMVPSAFVLLDEMPLTPNRKVDRRALPDPGKEALAVSQSEGASPRTEIEQLLHSIWSGVLKLGTFGIHDNFFALGGHSLLAMQVITRMRSALNIPAPLRELFMHPTVAELGRWVETALRDESSGAPALQRVARKGPLPLSFAQQRLWFIDQLEPGSSLYNMPLAVRLRGRLEVEALERVVNEIVRRHEVLRTSFELVDDEPVQVIAATQPMALVVEDLSELAVGQREEAVRELVKAEAQRPFDLRRGPLLRARLLRLGEEEHLAMLTMHHVISDGWSMEVLLREVALLYGAYARGEASPLPELEIQYADYAVWQREWLQGEELEGQLAYWRKQLSGAPAVLELPQDRLRPAVQTHQGATHGFVLGAEVGDRLKQVSAEAGVTTFMVLLAAWQVLLKGLSGSPDISVGTAVAGRTDAALEPLIGFFVNTLVLRTDLSGDPTFAELLVRVREVCVGAYSHQEVPFEKLVEELAPERSLAHTPLFQVMLVMAQRRAQEGRELEQIEGLAVSGVVGEGRSAKYDLTLQLQEVGGVLSGTLEYNTDIFEEERARRMVKQWERVLAAAVAQPQRRISELPLLSEAEREQLLVEWNQTAAEYPREMSLTQLFEGQVERTPEAIALISGHERISYQELNRRANQLAHHLATLGVGPEQLVGVCVDRSVEMVVALLGILKAGAAYLPLDPQYPWARLRFMLEDAGVQILLTQQHHQQRFAADKLEIVCLDTDGERLATQQQTNPGRAACGGNLAYVIYTSGSTGQPKGVAIEHRSAVALIEWATSTFSSAELSGVLASTSICFDLSIFELFVPLASGGRVIMAENALHLPQLPASSEVTLINTVPSAMAELVRMHAVPSSVRTVNLAGEPLGNLLVQGIYGQETVERVLNLYGPTEDTTYSTWAAVERGASGQPNIGRPIANAQVYILDADYQLVAVGVAGELYVGGEGVARGYLNRPALTSERFVPHPFSEKRGARLYRTGDLARYLPNGEIEFLGRMDHQVKIRGFRIELGEIETRLLQHPELREAVVVYQEGTEPRLAAYVVSADPGLTTADMRLYLKEQLPEFMVPSIFVLLEHLPLTANGKVDRRALQVRELDAPTLEDSFLAPRDVLEFRLAQIWEDVLGVKPIGVRDNFFELGGHSFLAVRLIARIKEKTGKTLPLALLMKEATIESLASELRQRRDPASPSALVAIRREGSAPAFFCVHPAGGNVLCYAALAQHLGSARPFYGFQARGLEDGEEPFTSIEAAASHYVAAMRAIQPEGPYLIGGWSIGGLIAFEMARLIQAQQQQIGLLALFDSHLHYENPAEEDEATLLINSALHMGLRREDLRPLRERLLTLNQDDQVDYALDHMRRHHLLPPDVEASQIRALIRVFKANLQAARNYLPRASRGRITLFKANEPLMESAGDPAADWIPLALDGVEVREVPGDHFAIMREPHVRVLAEQLNECLQQASDAVHV